MTRKPTKLVVGHCYTGIMIPAELVVGDGRTNDFVFKNTDANHIMREDCPVHFTYNKKS